ncbi:GCDH, partial [Symbiodinium pilosum]
ATALHSDPGSKASNASLPVTTSPPVVMPPETILRSLAQEIREELKETEHQGVVALI